MRNTSRRGFSSILFNSVVVESLLAYAKNVYPNEGILLLRGKNRGDGLRITEVVIPPLATHGAFFSAFPLHMLPFDLSIIGTAHSHPSGEARPSVADLNNFYGRIMVIIVPPFRSGNDIGIFNRDGDPLPFEVRGEVRS